MGNNILSCKTLREFTSYLLSSDQYNASGIYNLIITAKHLLHHPGKLCSGASAVKPKTVTNAIKPKLPFLLRGQLREYQEVGLQWLVAMEARKLNGILADEMGLG